MWISVVFMWISLIIMMIINDIMISKQYHIDILNNNRTNVSSKNTLQYIIL